MILVITGSIQFTKAEDWLSEALIDKHFATFVVDTFDQAVALGEWVIAHTAADAYLIPKQYRCRIYNNTADRLWIHETYAIEPYSRMEWHNIYDERYEFWEQEGQVKWNYMEEEEEEMTAEDIRDLKRDEAYDRWKDNQLTD